MEHRAALTKYLEQREGTNAKLPCLRIRTLAGTLHISRRQQNGGELSDSEHAALP
jgi:hypothetical protein